MNCQRTTTVNPGEYEDVFHLRYYILKSLAHRDALIHLKVTPIKGLPFEIVQNCFDYREEKEVQEGLAFVKKYVTELFGVEPEMKWVPSIENYMIETSPHETLKYHAIDIAVIGSATPVVQWNLSLVSPGASIRDLTAYERELEQLSQRSIGDVSTVSELRRLNLVEIITNIEFIKLQNKMRELPAGIGGFSPY